jgi:hypothetical protein
VTLNKLKEKMLKDQDIKELFLRHFPKLDYENIVEKTIAQMYDYAVDKNYDVLDLSLDGVKAFFDSVFDVEDEEEDDDEKYGKA